MKIFI